MRKLIFAFTCLFLAVPCLANPIPIPPPAMMPLEDMYMEITPVGDGLHAVFTGDFTFTYIPMDVLSMLFPVPPDADNIRTWQDGIEIPWNWSSELYWTILPELPTIPMLEWLGPFPSYAVFRVDYEHDLIKRPDEFIFFYASGTGKYFPIYDKITTAYFDILIPAGFTVAGVWLDYTAHEYEVVNGHLMITVQSSFGPIVNDLIVSLVQTPIYVATDGNDTTGDGSPENPFATIQKGIDSAVDGHTVIVRPGTYTGNGNRDIDFSGRSITLCSESGPETCIIDCENLLHRGFKFHSGEDANSVVSGFTITNGYVYNNNGGGIYCIGSSPTIEHCIISDNSAFGWESGYCFGETGGDAYGGGLYCTSNSNPTIINCIIINNEAAGGHGCDGTPISMSDSGPGGNGYGGAIYSDSNSNPTIENCLIAYNTASGGNGGIGGGMGYYAEDGGDGCGAGICCGTNGTLTIRDSTVCNNNTSGGNGGYAFGDLPTQAGDGGNAYGGAVYCDYNSELLAKNCIISRNTVSGGNGGDSPPFVPPSGDDGNGYGGAIYCEYGDANLSNCTISDNTSYGNGGGIYFLFTEITDMWIINCIIWGNSPNQIYTQDGNTGVVLCSNIQGGWPGPFPGGFPLSMDEEPHFADISNGDYHLQSEAGRWDPNSEIWVTDANTSPCIDAGYPLGNNFSGWTAELWPNGKRINMGAYGGTPQASMSLSDVGNIADLNNDGFVDYNDLRLFTDKWPNQEVLLKEDLDRNGFVDFIDFAIFAENCP